MSTPDNPYRPPEATLADHEADAAGRPPAGDLERALSGETTLRLQPVLKEAWRLVKGVKLVTNIAITLISLLYFIGVFVIFGVFVGFDLATWTDPVALNAKMVGLTTDPAYLLTTSLGFLPANVLLYLSVWGMGIRRSTGQDVSLGHAFPWHAYLPSLAVMALLVPFSLLTAVHALLGYLSLPLYLVLFWAMPLFLDRRASFGDAIKQSATLTKHNWAPMLGLGVVLFAAYMATLFTCGIGLLWFIPFACTALGESWRQLAGVEGGAG